MLDVAPVDALEEGMRFYAGGSTIAQSLCVVGL